MPAKPVWFNRINNIVWQLEQTDLKYVHRGIIETLFQTGRRRAQQILQGCSTCKFGGNVVADRLEFIAYLKAIQSGDEFQYEAYRRQQFAVSMDELRDRPRVMIEAPARIVNQQLEDLPAGISIEPGRITVEFASPDEGLRKLLALAMAIGNGQDEFERRASV